MSFKFALTVLPKGVFLMMSYILAKVSDKDKGPSGFTDRSRDIEAYLNQRRADKAQRMQQAQNKANQNNATNKK